MLKDIPLKLIPGPMKSGIITQKAKSFILLMNPVLVNIAWSIPARYITKISIGLVVNDLIPCLQYLRGKIGLVFGLLFLLG